MVLGIIPEITPDFYRVGKLVKGGQFLRDDYDASSEHSQRSLAKSRLLLSGERI